MVVVWVHMILKSSEVGKRQNNIGWIRRLQMIHPNPRAKMIEWWKLTWAFDILFQAECFLPMTLQIQLKQTQIGTWEKHTRTDNASKIDWKGGELAATCFFWQSIKQNQWTTRWSANYSKSMCLMPVEGCLQKLYGTREIKRFIPTTSQMTGVRYEEGQSPHQTYEMEETHTQQANPASQPPEF